MRITLTIITLLLITSCLTPKGDPAPEPVIIEKTEPTPEPEPVTQEINEPEEYVATEEEYDKTFNEIEMFIADLNTIISSGNFDKWQTHLSETYITKYGNPVFLTQLSDNPVLKDYGIKLKKLRDYFNYVVVPSRSKVVIDEIQFVTEDKIKAFTIINGEKIVVYLLIRSNESWIITD